jgi:mono/diheme cytochrome c family protein
MNKSILKVAAVLALLLPGSAIGQDPTAIAEGAQVYANNCARCHVARASSERSDQEWTVIILHMRARANLTRSQAVAVLAFLQATNLPETGVGTAVRGDVALPEWLTVPAERYRPLRAAPNKSGTPASQGRRP